MKGQRVGYIRVSTADQNTERQLEGIELDKDFTDYKSGKDTDRPKLAMALNYVREGDTLVVHSMDRLARNTEDMLRLVRELTERGVSIEFIKERLTFRADGNNHMDKLMLTMLGAFAELERNLMRERQREGIAIAKKNGVYKGRKHCLDDEQAAELKRRAAEPGVNKAALAREFNIARKTLYRYCSVN